MSNEDLQKAIEFAVSTLSKKDLPTYVRATLEPHLTALVFQQCERARAKQS